MKIKEVLLRNISKHEIKQWIKEFSKEHKTRLILEEDDCNLGMYKISKIIFKEDECL